MRVTLESPGIAEHATDSAAEFAEGTTIAVTRVLGVTFGEMMWLLLGAGIGVLVACVLPYAVRVVVRLLGKPPNVRSTSRTESGYADSGRLTVIAGAYTASPHIGRSL